MFADTLTAELDASPFHPLRLRLTDGSAVDVPTPYLSFIHNNHALFLAQAIDSRTDPRPRVGLIPLTDIRAVEPVA
jgi:hypothetical protein